MCSLLIQMYVVVRAKGQSTVRALLRTHPVVLVKSSVGLPELGRDGAVAGRRAVVHGSLVGDRVGSGVSLG